MKTIKRALAALLALTALAGCRNTEQEVPETGSLRTVLFHAGTVDTRTAFTEAVDGVYRTLWTENDTDVLLSLNYGKAEASAVTRSADGSTASFEASFDASAATSPYTFYAVSPASAARAISPSRNAWSVYIAAEQTPSALSVDEAAQLLVAKSAASTTLPEEVNLHFSHLTAYGRITLNNMDLKGSTVRKVDLVFSTPVVGEFYWGEDGTLTSNGASHTITLNTDAAGDLWFACAPVDVSGATMQLTVFTELGELTKEITFPEGRKFNSAKVARFSLDMAGLEFRINEGYFPVTDVNTLQVGDKLLIVNEAGTYALGQQLSFDGTRLEREVEIVEGRIANPGRATVLTLAKGAVSNTWAFKTNTGKYLSAVKSGDELTEKAEIDAFSSWTVSIDAGVTMITAQAGESRLILHEHEISAFTCYPPMVSSEHEQVVLYRLGTNYAPAAEEDPLTAQSEYGAYLAGSEWAYVKGADQYRRSYDSDGKLEFVLLNAPEKEQLVISGFDPSLAKGDAAVVTVSWRKGRQVMMQNKTFNLRVVKEDGSKVWLGDGSGQGFIIKK